MRRASRGAAACRRSAAILNNDDGAELRTTIHRLCAGCFSGSHTPFCLLLATDC